MNPNSDTNNNKIVLDDRNIIFLSSICDKFLQDKYNITYNLNILKKTTYNIATSIVNYHTSNPPFPAFEEINKIILSEVKKYILNQFTTLSQNEKGNEKEKGKEKAKVSKPIKSQSTRLEEELLQRKVDMQKDTNIVLTTTKEYLDPPIIETKTDLTETDFFEKLKELELKRDLITTPLQEEVKPPVVPTIPENKLPFIASSSKEETSTIIYVPTSSKTVLESKPILINSVERMWNYFHSRSILVWNGPMPNNILHFYFSCLMMPKVINTITPYIIVEIEAIGNKKMEIICLCESGISENTNANINRIGWDIWKPQSKSMSILKQYACPWTFKLFDCYRSPIDLGNDGIKIINTELLQTGNTQIYIDDLETNIEDIELGNRLLIKNEDNTQVKTYVTNKVGKQFSVKGNLINSKNGILCNLSKQCHILLEIYEKKNEKKL